LRKLNDEVSDAPSGAMEEVAREGLLSQAYYLTGDLKMALVAADKALLLAQNQNGQQLFVWPAYTVFVETYLSIWDDIQKDKDRTLGSSATDFLLPSSGAWEVDEEGRPSVDLSGEAGLKIVLKYVEGQVKQGITVLEKNSEYMNVITPALLRYKGDQLWLSGKKEKAMTLWEQSQEKAKELGMVFEEARALQEIGKSMTTNKCRCLVKRRHNVSCAIHHLELANNLFVKCGALLYSQQAVNLIETHHKNSSTSTTTSMTKSYSSEVLLTSEDASSSTPSIYEVLCTQDAVV